VTARVPIARSGLPARIIAAVRSRSTVVVRVYVASALIGLGAVACGGQAARAPATTASASATATPARIEAPASAPPSAPRARPGAAAIYAQIEPELVRCYERGKKTTPTMLDGKLTLNASVDASGKATCSIPTDDTGLTQEVEDCMSARLAAQSFDEGAPFSPSVPVVVRAGKVQLGARAASESFGIESVETHRMPDAFDVIESLSSELAACLHGLDRSSGVRRLMVGARVATDGRAQCALASAPAGDLPPAVADCAAGVLRRAKFPPPKGGEGLVLVPLNVR
jgi:hypothetical protein